MMRLDMMAMSPSSVAIVHVGVLCSIGGIEKCIHQSLIWVGVLMVFPKPSWISNDSVTQSQVLPCDRSGKVHAAHITCQCRWKVWGTELCSRLS
mmetsp:Transcript_734/g.3025  ORF Transcript_734/g.3025 Transcript_734/m.3025 type:complete len:94 (-) Transcript_734:352-633(-)